jgi:hypothetical protein
MNKKQSYNNKKNSKQNSKTTSKQNSKNTSKQNSKNTSKQNSKNTSKKTSIKNKKEPKIKNAHSFRNIKKNITLIKNKLEDKNLSNVFWVLADRADFKPLTKTVIRDDEEIKTIIHSIKELRDHMLDEKGEYYKGKKLASIKITIYEDVINKMEKSNYNGFINNTILTHKDFLFIKEKPILTITITIFPINNEGAINHDSSWNLKVNYFIDDFTGIKFKLKNVEVLMRLVSDLVIKSDIDKGITYKNLSNQLNKKNKK